MIGVEGSRRDGSTHDALHMIFSGHTEAALPRHRPPCDPAFAPRQHCDTAFAGNRFPANTTPNP